VNRLSLDCLGGAAAWHWHIFGTLPHRRATQQPQQPTVKHTAAVSLPHSTVLCVMHRAELSETKGLVRDRDYKTIRNILSAPRKVMTNEREKLSSNSRTAVLFRYATRFTCDEHKMDAPHLFWMKENWLDYVWRELVGFFVPADELQDMWAGVSGKTVVCEIRVGLMKKNLMFIGPCIILIVE